MSSHAENSAWQEAQENEDRNFKPTKANRRRAPFYKVLQGMPISVDAFRYGAIPGVNAYFLTHAHSDHYTNLSSNWKHGPIYCSETTANLVIHMLDVDKQWVHPLPMDQTVTVPNSGGVKVTLIEANHCPGSCLFLFEGPQTVNAGDSQFKSPYVGSSRAFRYLHCGDFRACPQHILHPAVRGKKIDHVYLDTTYLDPKYCFPPQPLVIAACADLAKRIVNGEDIYGEAGSNGAPSIQGWVTTNGDEKGKGKATCVKNEVEGKTGKTLVVVGTYSIGKERIVKEIAKALDTKIYCDPRKKAILQCESDPELHTMLTNDPLNAGVHIVPLGMINSDKFQTYMDRWDGHFAKAVGFRPTGWTYTPPAGTDQSPSIPFIIARDQKRTFTCMHLKPMRNSTPKLMLYGVPYSEHSSFFELTCFALSFEWVKMIATVNVGSQNSRAKIARWVEKWEAEKRKRRKEGNGKDGMVPFRRTDYW
ncbi:DRMBL-domain-containing protein [Rickenella mellea]|uniref:DRMBL-domain-containing protein n=1 Tax=Rickenella mellea TaxID=50990 RepID=A0A4Y7PJU3_9AGAM|nr:DRMBL-domain-containing protein [Rickenella mellea]